MGYKFFKEVILGHIRRNINTDGKSNEKLLLNNGVG
jgi:hypothetical protein